MGTIGLVGRLSIVAGLPVVHWLGDLGATSLIGGLWIVTGGPAIGVAGLGGVLRQLRRRASDGEQQDEGV